MRDLRSRAGKLAGYREREPCVAARIAVMTSSGGPATRTILVRAVVPETIVKSDLASPQALASRAIAALFALPRSATAVTAILRALDPSAFSAIPAISFRCARGVTRIVTRTPSGCGDSQLTSLGSGQC